MRKIVDLLDSKLKYQSIFLMFLMTIASLLELLGLGLVIIIINSFLGLDNIYPTIIQNFLNFISTENDQISIYIILIYVTILFTIKLFILIFTSYRENKFLAILRENISNKMYRVFLNRDLLNLLKKNSATYLRNFTEEINISILFFTSVIKTFMNLVILTAFLIFLFVFNKTITSLVLFIFSSIGIIYFLNIKNKLSSWANQSIQNRKKRIQYVNESFLAIKTIKILSREKFFFEKFKLQNKIFSNLNFKVNFLKSLPASIFEYILLITILLLLYLLLINNYSNEKIIQVLSVYSLCAFRIVPVLNRILGSAQQIRFSYPSVKRLIEESEHKIVEKNTSIKKVSFKKSVSLKFKNFTFEKNKDPLLKNISIQIKKNSKIGIIGPSGSGKSTIVDIICGFRSFKGCNLKVDDKIIDNKLENWQKLIGYIPQNIIILNASLRENLLFGSKNKEFSDNYLIKLIKRVELQHLLKKTKKGLSQIIRQDGLDISGGEKQRIGIARALINNPELIILDEATSGLDYYTEKKVLDTINRFKKTAIVVSHRLSALNFCDKVHIIENKTLKILKNNQIKKFF